MYVYINGHILVGAVAVFVEPEHPAQNILTQTHEHAHAYTEPETDVDTQ